MKVSESKIHTEPESRLSAKNLVICAAVILMCVKVQEVLKEKEYLLSIHVKTKQHQGRKVTVDIWGVRNPCLEKPKLHFSGLHSYNAIRIKSMMEGWPSACSH